jgi:nicotinate-nucleotide adenylyltransferase
MYLNMSQWIRPPGPVADRLRVGLLGGSFNPAHRGHLHISKSALKALGLDYVWWLVSPQNPLKSIKDMTSLAQRLSAAREMTKHPRITVTNIEDQLGTLYTADTLALLLQRFPTVHFIWLMGSDNLVQIPGWRDWQDIFMMMPVAVVARPGTVLKARRGPAAQKFAGARVSADKSFANRLPPAWTIIETQHDTTSATQIRSDRQP